MKGGFKKLSGGCINWDTVWFIIIVLIIFALWIGFTYVLVINPNHTGKSREYFADAGDVDLTPNGDETVVALYSASWCPHCQDYKPMWGKMKGSGVATTKSGKKVRFVDVDCSDGAHASCENYKVKGYPTVVAITASGNKQLSRPTTLDELDAEL
jgi:thiol-disulfide isomerase/thioredoxin